MRDLLKQLFSPWVILGAGFVAAVLIGSMIMIPSLTTPITEPGPPTAAVSLIPAPTLTPDFTATPQPTVPPTIEIPPSPAPGTFAIGAVVQITGTQGEGLNLREEPGLDSNINYLGFESEVFTIQDGPREVDGFTWWFLVGFSDDTRNGWGVTNYLAVVQSPR